MAKLNKNQKSFLKHHGFKESDVLDGECLTVTTQKEIMKRQKIPFVIGVAPCQAAGHTIRDRSRNCVMCQITAIGYRKNYYESGFIYVAFSEKLGYVKIGKTIVSIKSRIQSLNAQKYANADDWEIIKSAQVPSVGEVEKLLLDLLRKYEINVTYIKNKKIQLATELFEVSKRKALGLFNQVLKTQTD